MVFKCKMCGASLEIADGKIEMIPCLAAASAERLHPRKESL